MSCGCLTVPNLLYVLYTWGCICIIVESCNVYYYHALINKALELKESVLSFLYDYITNYLITPLHLGEGLKYIKLLKFNMFIQFWKKMNLSWKSSRLFFFPSQKRADCVFARQLVVNVILTPVCDLWDSAPPVVLWLCYMWPVKLQAQ